MEEPTDMEYRYDEGEGEGEDEGEGSSLPFARGGPINNPDFLGPITSVFEFKAAVLQELEGLEAELVSAGDFDEELSVDEIRVYTEGELVEKALKEGSEVLTSIGNFCICSIAVGMVLEIIVMFPIQHRSYRDGINNLLVLLIGGIPIAMPTVLSVTLAIGSHCLSQQGAITKRMTAIEEMAGMDVLCSDKTGTLTLNRLTVDRNLIEVFHKETDRDMIVLLAARASRLENQDAIDTAIINMLADPKEARANITEAHFLPFNPVDKRTAITYIDSDGNWWRASKGAPEQILNLCHDKHEIAGRVHAIIDKIAERGLRSLGVAYQSIPEKAKENPGGPWIFCGLLPLFDPPRHDSAETIRRALNLGVCVKMITEPIHYHLCQQSWGKFLA